MKTYICVVVVRSYVRHMQTRLLTAVLDSSLNFYSHACLYFDPRNCAAIVFEQRIATDFMCFHCSFFFEFVFFFTLPLHSIFFQLVARFSAVSFEFAFLKCLDGRSATSPH